VVQAPCKPSFTISREIHCSFFNPSFHQYSKYYLTKVNKKLAAFLLASTCPHSISSNTGENFHRIPTS